MHTRRAILGLLPCAPAYLRAQADDEIREITTYRHPQGMFVRVKSASGAFGWGEAESGMPELMETFIHAGLKKNAIGQSIWDAERVWDRMFFDQHDLGPGGALTGAISGIDLALWDLRGRVLKQPVYRLIGGKYRDRVKVYGSFGVGFGRRMNPRQAAEKAKKFVSRGYLAVKVRMQIRESRQNPEPDPTFEFVKAVREAIGPKTELLVDINNGYTAERAIAVGLRLRDEFGARYFEDPVSDQHLEDYAAVTSALHGISTIAGEKQYTRWQLRDLIVRGNVDYINPDVIKAGGLTEMKKIAAIAQAYQKPVICHNTRPTVSTAASLHFMASIPNAGPFFEAPDDDEFEPLLSVATRHYRFENGYLTVPSAPGLGIDFDEPKLRAASKVV
ncbi:MAG: mandelate racemase/muconate lactonizing enzyme family protein [Bryobacterales bacterium]|nr:mandelate racemase/muconate lactonizing enzyme family protein [Bryobacterales bacterium]